MKLRTAVPIALVGLVVAVASAPPSSAQYPGHVGRFVSAANGLTTYAKDGTGKKVLDLGAKLVGQDTEYPSYTPSGRMILFDAAKSGADFEIFRVRARGGTATRLTNNTTDDWGADQGPARIVFVCARASSDEICTMRPDGTGLTRLTHNDDQDWNPTWTPNGARIVFSSDRRGDHDIFSMRPDGTGVRPLTDDPSGEFEPDVSPDGTRIVFWSDATNPGELVVIHLDGTHRNVLAVAAPYPDDPRTPVWSPNGTRIAFGVGTQIWVRRPNDDTGAIRTVVASGANDNIGWQPLP